MPSAGLICLGFSFDPPDELNGSNSVPGKKKILVIAAAVIVVVTGILIAGYCFHRNKRRVKGN